MSEEIIKEIDFSLIKECLCCNKVFVLYDPYSKCCSKECREQHNESLNNLFYDDYREINCLYCNSKFIPKPQTNKFCSDECCKNSYKITPKPINMKKECRYCKSKFTPIDENQIYCKKICRKNDFKPNKEIKKSSEIKYPKIPKIPYGRYVYAWFKENEILPFYIGKGVDYRAWQKHTLDDGTTAFCEQVKISAKKFRVKIIREGLTEEGALLLEGALINFITDSCGWILSNQVIGCQRTEVLPLIIKDVKDYL